MITAKLINPRIVKNELGESVSFDQTMILENDSYYERREINLPYSMPDPEIEAWVIQQAQDKAAELEITQAPQETLQWDWPEGIE